MIVIVVMALISTVWLLLKVNYSKRIKNYKGRVIAKVIDVKENVYYERSLWGYYNKLRYPLDSEVVIYYDEKKPQRSAVGGRMEEELREDDIRHAAFVTGILWLIVLFGIYVRFSSDFQ